MGSKKKSTVGYRYKTGVHMILGLGPLDSITKIKYGDKTAWEGMTTGGQVTINAPNLYGGDDGEGGISGAVDVLMGAPDQARNDYLLARQGEFCPAYRGVASLVFRDAYWGNSPYYKSVTVRATRIFSTEDGSASWHAGTAAINAMNAVSAQLGPTSTGWRYKQIALGDNSDYSSPSFDDTDWPVGTMPFASASGQPYAAENGFPTMMGTYWALNTAIWIRKKFTVSNKSQIDLEIFIDNVADVWVNGTKLVNSVDTTQSKVSLSIPSSVVVVGENIIVMRGTDDTQIGSGDYTYAAFRLSQLGYDLYDMNPAHMIREALNRVKKVPIGQIDDANFRACADRLYSEGFGLSCIWAGETSADEFIQDILDVIDARIYIHPRTKLYTIKLIRKDYSLDDLPVLGHSQIKRVEDYMRPVAEELPNSVAVTYWDTKEGSDVTVQSDDPAAIITAGRVNSLNRDYSDTVTRADIAARIAQRDLIAAGSPLLSCKLTCTTAAADLLPGDAFLFDWAALHDEPIVMRVVKTKRGGLLNRRVVIEAVESVFELDDIAAITVAPPAWEDPRSADLDKAQALAFEAPYYELVQRFGEARTNDFLAITPDAGMVLATAAKADNAINATVFVDGDEWAKAADLSPVGTLNADANYLDNPLDITWPALPATGSHIQIGDELMRFDGLDDNGKTLVGRGILDTVPAQHSAGVTAWAWDAFAVTDEVEHAEGESVSVQLQLRNNSRIGAIGDSVNVPFAARASRPYPPANVKINASYFPACIKGNNLAITWVHRDRKQQTASLVGFTEGSIGPESGVTYTAEFRDEAGTLRRTYSAVSGTSQTWTTEVDDCGLFGQGDPIYHIESFNSQIPANYAAWRYQTSNTLTATFDASTGAVFLDNPTSRQAFWDISSLSNMFDIDLEMDFELISDTFGQQHVGFWLSTGVGSPNGYRIARQTGGTPKYGVHYMVNGNWSALALAAPTLQSDQNLALNSRNRLRVVWSAATGLFSLYCNGSKIFDTTVADFTYRSLRPGIFLYGCKIRVHEIICNGHSVLNRLNNQVTANISSVRGSLSSYQPFEFKTARVGYGYSYGLSYGGL